MRECVDQGILQAYTDNELSSEMAARVAEHINGCAACASAAREVAEETALFATAFDAELALEVPTVRLRERLDEAIAELERPARLYEQRPARSFGGWLASLGGLFNVSPQRALGFASLVAVLAFAAIFAVIRLNRPGTESVEQPIARDGGNVQSTTSIPKSDPSPSPIVTSSPSDAPVEKDNSNKRGGKENTPVKRQKPRKPAAPVLVPEPDQLPQQELAITVKPLPGEQNYLKAIDSLAQEIAASGDGALKPSLRSEYERNLAIVDQAIVSTRRMARSNPNDPDAAEFLYSSYQSKINLLNTVAEQVRPTIATR